MVRKYEDLTLIPQGLAGFHPILFKTSLLQRFERKLKYVLAPPRYAELISSSFIEDVSRAIHDSEIDVIYCTSPQMIRVVRYALKALNCSKRPKLVLYTFDANLKIALRMWLQFRQHSAHHVPLIQLLKWINLSSSELEDYAYSDVVLCASRSDQSFIKSLFPGKRIYFAPAWYDGFGTELRHKITDHTLLYVGNARDKRTLDALSWFISGPYQLIQQQVPDVLLKIIAGPPTSAFANIVRHERVSAATNTILGNDLLNSYAGAAIVIAPLFQGGGIHVKLLTAIACGTPIVATSIANDGLEAQDDISICLADDEKTFAQKCIYLLLNPAAGEEMAIQAQLHLQKTYNSTSLSAILKIALG